MKTIRLELSIGDAEPILRQHAELAAMYSGLLDYITRRTGNDPRHTGESLDEARERWRKVFLRCKRVVELFGVEFSPTSEAEALTVDHPYKRRKDGTHEHDLKNPFPSYRRAVHAEACRQAADRTVRAWRAVLERRRDPAANAQDAADRDLWIAHCDRQDDLRALREKESAE